MTRASRICKPNPRYGQWILGIKGPQTSVCLLKRDREAHWTVMCNCSCKGTKKGRNCICCKGSVQKEKKNPKEFCKHCPLTSMFTATIDVLDPLYVCCHVIHTGSEHSIIWKYKLDGWVCSQIVIETTAGFHWLQKYLQLKQPCYPPFVCWCVTTSVCFLTER